MNDVTFVVYSEELGSADALIRQIEGSGHARVVATACDQEELRKRVADIAPHAVLALLGADPHASLDAVAEIHGQVAALYVCGPQDDSSLLLRALKFGAKEYFPSEPGAAEIDAAREARTQTFDCGSSRGLEIQAPRGSR